MSSFTPAQRRAIEAPGNVLVVAGAGTGKTRTLVERCLRRVLSPEAPVSLERVLMVTFTEAAAGEMRQRIRLRLAEEARKDPGNGWLEEQLALVDGALISTLHSFCLQLAREHFHELGLDPHLSVLDEAQAEILAAETLQQTLQRHYAGATPQDEAVRRLLRAYGGGRPEVISGLVRRIHDYTQALPDPGGWHEAQRRDLAAPQPGCWREWLPGCLEEWRREWLQALEEVPGDNPNAQACLGALRHLAVPVNLDQAGLALRRILEADGQWPPRRKSACREPLAKLFSEAGFLVSLLGPAADRAAETQPAPDPLQEDWDWVRPHLSTLLSLAHQFTARFGEAKRELGVVDFHDLEQCAVRLLWDQKEDGPTAIARRWRQRLELVFVDEYQDINAAQDRIIQAVSREGVQANRFLVGDVKQSIYRFRLANPKIFQHYADSWTAQAPTGGVISLADNFRSHEAILDFVNPLFTLIMRREVGGVAYSEEAWLRFGDLERRRLSAGNPEPEPATDAAAVRAAGPWVANGASVAVEGPGRGTQPSRHQSLSTAGSEMARVELWLLLSGKADAAEESDSEGSPPGRAVLGQSSTEREAWQVGCRLLELREERFGVWDSGKKAVRPVAWRDMVILLRSPRNKAESFAKIFNRLGIPLISARRGLYEAAEASDLLSLLRVLDNPLQDLPALALARSPLVGLGTNELAVIRLHQRSGHWWTAWRKFHATPPGGSTKAPLAEVAAIQASAWTKTDLFLGRYRRWREMARRGSLSRCLEAVLEETHYEDWLAAHERGEQRRANVQRLVALTRQFDQFQRQGLFRFLRFVEAQQAAEIDPEPAALAAEDAVRLMSIHQSKGLEFPVVVVADLGKRFNWEQLRDRVILDEEHGVCAIVQPPGAEPTYPSLPYWLAARRQHRESLGEELRLLYVAMTRAGDKLILSGAAPAGAPRRWAGEPGATLTPRRILEAKTCLDWLGPALASLLGREDWHTQPRGDSPRLSWRLDPDGGAAERTGGAASPAVSPLASLPGAPPPVPALASAFAAQQAASLAALQARIGWAYPHRAATTAPAKSSVSVLRRRVTEENEAETRRWFPQAQAEAGVAARPRPGAAAGGSRLSAAEIGAAHHRFLELVSLAAAGSEAGLRAEAQRLEGLGALSPAQTGVLDWGELAAFWQSELGARIRTEAVWVRRELEFTARLTAADLEALGLPGMRGMDADEFLVVQGAADLAVIRPREIWLVDFKTDHLAASEVAERAAGYRPQLALYCLALGRIYQRRVTEAWLHFLRLGQTVEAAPRVAE